VDTYIGETSAAGWWWAHAGLHSSHRVMNSASSHPCCRCCLSMMYICPEPSCAAAAVPLAVQAPELCIHKPRLLLLGWFSQGPAAAGPCLTGPCCCCWAACKQTTMWQEPPAAAAAGGQGVAVLLPVVDTHTTVLGWLEHTHTQTHKNDTAK
jgi:hypothetical protein